jgi:3-isopropylmalate/(R)-2-methylmalate dehydratase small subunit
MTPFRSHEGIVAPLFVDDLNTDVIIPTSRAVHVKRGEMGRYAFEPMRYALDGSEKPSFPLNQPRYRDASILLTGQNFGCGSSREMAVWAIWAAGIRCVIAPSFGDIFYSNCCKNGLLPVRLPQAEIERIATALEREDKPQLGVDLEKLEISTPTLGTIRFTMEDGRRDALLNGLDDIGLTLRYRAAIEKWAERDRAARPWIHAAD